MNYDHWFLRASFVLAVQGLVIRTECVEFMPLLPLPLDVPDERILRNVRPSAA